VPQPLELRPGQLELLDGAKDEGQEAEGLWNFFLPDAEPAKA
jgi:hypothetical protein